jgi:hypothetical protein
VIGDIVYFKISKLINENTPRLMIAEGGGGGNQDRSRQCHQLYLQQKGFKDPLLIGKIVSFVRHNATDAVQVKIRPLRVRCVECESNLSSGSPPKGGRHDHPPHSHHTYELHLDHLDQGDIILSSNMLAHYPAVLSSNSYERLAYSSTDLTIYMSSPQWEGAMVYHTDSEYSQDDGNTTHGGRAVPSYLQQSQDY